MPTSSRTSRAAASSWMPPPRRAFRPALALLAAVLLLVGIAPRASSAQGFGVFEQGACVMARAGATVADACGDGSSIYFNPANLSDNEGLTITVGGTLVDAFGDYTSGITGRVSDLQNDPILVPHFYASYQVNDNLTAGLGAYVPYGLSTEWNRSFEGAFEGYNNGVEAIYIQPTVSYRVSESFSLGGGPIVAISSVELNQVVDLSAQSLPGTETPFAAVGIPHHTAFADVTLEGHNAIGFGANVGATYNLNDRFAIAGRFTTPIKVTYDGDATFSQIQTGLRTRAPLGPFSAGSSLDDILALQFDEGLNPGATRLWRELRRHRPPAAPGGLPVDELVGPGRDSPQLRQGRARRRA